MHLCSVHTTLVVVKVGGRVHYVLDVREDWREFHLETWWRVVLLYSMYCTMRVCDMLASAKSSVVGASTLLELLELESTRARRNGCWFPLSSNFFKSVVELDDTTTRGVPARSTRRLNGLKQDDTSIIPYTKTRANPSPLQYILPGSS